MRLKGHGCVLVRPDVRADLCSTSLTVTAETAEADPATSWSVEETLRHSTRHRLVVHSVRREAGRGHERFEFPGVPELIPSDAADGNSVAVRIPGSSFHVFANYWSFEPRSGVYRIDTTIPGDPRWDGCPVVREKQSAEGASGEELLGIVVSPDGFLGSIEIVPSDVLFDLQKGPQLLPLAPPMPLTPSGTMTSLVAGMGEIQYHFRALDLATERATDSPQASLQLSRLEGVQARIPLFKQQNPRRPQHAARTTVDIAWGPAHVAPGSVGESCHAFRRLQTPLVRVENYAFFEQGDRQYDLLCVPIESVYAQWGTLRCKQRDAPPTAAGNDPHRAVFRVNGASACSLRDLLEVIEQLPAEKPHLSIELRSGFCIEISSKTDLAEEDAKEEGLLQANRYAKTLRADIGAYLWFESAPGDVTEVEVPGDELCAVDVFAPSDVFEMEPLAPEVLVAGGVCEERASCESAVEASDFGCEDAVVETEPRRQLDTPPEQPAGVKELSSLPVEEPSHFETRQTNSEPPEIREEASPEGQLKQEASPEVQAEM